MSPLPPDTAAPILPLMRALGLVFSALFGLVFGSFLNVCLTRWPLGESIVHPRSHCRNCPHSLAWWENIPILSWLILRGRCRGCQSPISWRYPLIEFSVAFLWAAVWLHALAPALAPPPSANEPTLWFVTTLLGYGLFAWLLVALAALDAEHFWLPDRLTYPAIALALIFNGLRSWAASGPTQPFNPLGFLASFAIATLAPAGLILFIRFAYRLVRHQEGIGLGDAKLMAMLGAWLGIAPALESFATAIFAAAVTALLWLALIRKQQKSGQWAQMPLPLGTFLSLAACLELFFPLWLFYRWAAIFLQ